MFGVPGDYCKLMKWPYLSHLKSYRADIENLSISTYFEDAVKIELKNFEEMNIEFKDTVITTIASLLSEDEDKKELQRCGSSQLEESPNPVMESVEGKNGDSDIVIVDVVINKHILYFCIFLFGTEICGYIHISTYIHIYPHISTYIHIYPRYIDIYPHISTYIHIYPHISTYTADLSRLKVYRGPEGL